MQNGPHAFKVDHTGFCAFSKLFTQTFLIGRSTKDPDGILFLSKCLMTPSATIAKATIVISNGLSAKSRSNRSRKDPVTAFPEGSMEARPVPAKRLADVTDLLTPRDKEILGTDTIFPVPQKRPWVKSMQIRGAS
jgi:hypothetical protein